MTGFVEINDASINAQFNDIDTLMSRQTSALAELQDVVSGTSLICDNLQAGLESKRPTECTYVDVTGPRGFAGITGPRGPRGFAGITGPPSYSLLSGSCLINHRIRQLHETVLRQNHTIERLKDKMSANRGKLAQISLLQDQKLDQLKAYTVQLSNQHDQRTKQLSDLEIALKAAQEQVDALTKQNSEKDEQLAAQTRQIVDLEFERDAFKEQVDALTKQNSEKDEQLAAQTRQIVDLEFERDAFKEYARSRR